MLAIKNLALEEKKLLRDSRKKKMALTAMVHVNGDNLNKWGRRKPLHVWKRKNKSLGFLFLKERWKQMKPRNMGKSKST